VAIVQAQRSLSRAEAQERSAPDDRAATKKLAKAKAKNGLRSPNAESPPKRLAAADPFAAQSSGDRYADRYGNESGAGVAPGFDFNNPPEELPKETDTFPDAAAVEGLAADEAAGSVRRNPFATGADREPQTNGPELGGSESGVSGASLRLAAADDAAGDRYTPGSIRGEPPVAAKTPRKKPAKKKTAGEPLAGAYRAEAAASVDEDRYGRQFEEQGERANPESQDVPAEEPLANSMRSNAANGGFQDFRPAPQGQEPSGDEGTGKPGGKHLEGAQAPSLTLEKLAPKEIQVGKPAIFEVRVRNTGEVVAHGVEIREETPQGTRLLSANPPASQPDGNQVVWAIGTMRPGEETTVALEVMPISEGEIGSVATVHFASQASARTRCTRPQLTLEVQGPREVLIGENATLTIKVSNPGTGTTTGIFLSENIPEQLSHPAGPDLEYEIGELKPNETRQLDLTLKAVRAGQVANRLMARADAQLVAQQQTELTVVAPQLEVAVQGPKRRYLERQATYTMLVSNPGTAPAKEVELVTHLPKGLKFVEANNAGEYDPQTNSVHWLLDELPPQETGQVTLTTLPVEPGEQMLRLEGTAQRGLSAAQEETIQIEGVAAILFQVVDAADPIEVGGETTYEIRVVNQGSKAATNIQLRAELPAELKPVDAQGPTRYELQGQVVEFEPLARLAPKADTTFRLRVQGLQAGDLRVQVQLKTDEMQTPVTKEESTRVYADE
jgi:uncharacterized repeat protein (TIGR01451 family)